MLNARLKLIFGELIGAESPLTSRYSANELNVTSRTIRSDVKELDRSSSKNGAAVQSIRGAGYRGLSIKNDRLFRQLLQHTFHQELSNSRFSERILYLLKRLLN